MYIAMSIGVVNVGIKKFIGSKRHCLSEIYVTIYKAIFILCFVLDSISKPPRSLFSISLLFGGAADDGGGRRKWSRGNRLDGSPSDSSAGERAGAQVRVGLKPDACMTRVGEKVA